MKVRLTSNNIIPNSTFELWDFDTNSPTQFYAASGVYNGDNWGFTTPQNILSANSFRFITEMSNPYNYLKVYKEASIKGVGTYKPCISENAVALNALNYEKITIEATEIEISTNGLNQQFTSGTELSINEIGAYFEIETTMLRKPNYSENITAEPLIVRNKNSKELFMAEDYQPVSTQLDFALCLEESRAVQAFFSTCIAYGVGFSLEILIDGLEARAWATQVWGLNWGYSDGESEYSPKISMDLNTCEFTELPTVGLITVPIILQKSELNYVSY